MARYVPAVVALFLIVICSLVQGNWSERWADFPELETYAEQLANVPTDIGDWHSVGLDEPEKRIMEAAGAVGSLSRNYTNGDGQTVSLFIVTGRLQDMFYHEPKRCYKAAGFEMQGDRRRFDKSIGDGQEAAFFAGRFIKSEVTSHTDKMVYWSFSADGKWLAPEEPKWEFRGQHALYKIYLIYEPSRTDDLDKNPATEFIPVLIPELNKAFAKAFQEALPSDEDSE